MDTEIYKISAHVIKRAPNLEQIIFDYPNRVLRIVGQTLSLQAPFSDFYLEGYGLVEGGMLKSKSFCLNIDLALDEYNECAANFCIVEKAFI